ncbi:MAG TPA: malonate decarboxylase holo-ACP synthase [Mycobacteriales bacterium]|nr:malonate decarboxylase holo-ACP synthase [Mycobacteriales bacterium]
MRPHDLLRLDAPLRPAGVPGWVAAALAETPWVVVRRATAAAGTIPVGVRGPTRADRFAVELDPATVAEVVRPEDLAERPGLPALDRARDVLAPTGWAWGPTGGVGFQLATGRPTVTAASDLDLVIRVPALPPRGRLGEVHAALPHDADCLIETPDGAVALRELVSGATRVLLRTPTGPRLVPA